MSSLNRVFLIGNLTKDPEIRYTPSGKAVGDLRLAVTSKFKDNEDTCYVDVTVWDRQAETCGEYLRKGRPILVEGRLKFDEWERDGQKRSRLSVVASRVQFMGSPRDGEDRPRQDADDRPKRDNDTDDQPKRDNDTDARDAQPPTDEPAPAAGGDDLQDEDNLPF